MNDEDYLVSVPQRSLLNDHQRGRKHHTKKCQRLASIN